jgi:hypothetical protein
LLYFYQKLQLKKVLLFFLVSLILTSCTKEVQIDVPGYEAQLVVDGRIETNGFPIVLLSSSQNIYAETDLSAYLNSFITTAQVSVSNGSQTIQLSLFSVNSLPIESQKTLAEMLRLELNEVVLLPIQVYSTNDATFLGEVGKKYTLQINHLGKSYTGTTELLAPVALNKLYWKPEESNTEYGYSWGQLSDPANQYNAYLWEAKRINKKTNGQPIDEIFKKAGDFDDRFFDGLTFDFPAANPQKRKDSTILEEYKRYYRFGDTAVIKLSRMDFDTYAFFDKKSAQLSSGGNPFATPVNIPTNMKGGALGIWAGYSPWFDTLICIP